MAMRVLVELKVFAMLSEKAETSLDEIARRSGADQVLLRTFVPQCLRKLGDKTTVS